MVDFDLIRSTIVRGLSSHLGMPVIESDTGADLPPYPFMTYNFITMGGVRGYAGRTILPGPNNSLIEQYSEQPIMTISINAHAIRKADSITNAMRAQEWFSFIGHDDMKMIANVVVVEMGDIHGRDIQVGDEWERKNGFDVDVRATSTVKVIQLPIESATLRSD